MTPDDRKVLERLESRTRAILAKKPPISELTPYFDDVLRLVELVKTMARLDERVSRIVS